MRIPAGSIVSAVATLAGAACARSDSRVDYPPPHAATHPFHPASDTVRLRDDTFSVLARPIAASRDGAGRLAIADESDRNVKVYAANGRRVATIGAAGRQAGQFTQLSNAQYLADSLVAYDFHTATLSVFAPATNRLVRSLVLKPAPYSVRVVDDSLFLFIRHPGQGGRLLSLARPDGRVTASFFQSDAFASAPQLRFLSATYADASDGLVFAGLFGADSLHIFDYSGREIGAVAVPARRLVVRLGDALRRNGGAMKKPDSTWFHDGIVAVMGIIALGHGDAAVQVAPYDTRIGTDLMRTTSEVVVIHAGTVARAGVVARFEGIGRLLARDADGGIILAAAPDKGSPEIVLTRWVLP